FQEMNHQLVTATLLLSWTAMFSTACRTCNLTEKAETRQNEILGRMSSFLGIRPDFIERSLTDEMLQNARIDALRDLDLDIEDREKPESIHVFASGNADPEQPSAVFAFSHKTAKRTVEKATLSVYLRRPTRAISLPNSIDLESPLVSVDVFERTSSGEIGAKIATRLVTVPLNAEFSHTTVPLDSEDVQRWLVEGGASLYVVANNEGENLAVMPDDEDASLKRIVLAMKVSGVPRRRRRQAHCTPDMKEKSCCLYDLIVDFEQIGWKFIIAPLKYNAYMCSGDCASTKKETVYGQLDATSRLQATNYNSACCHPDSFDSLDVIYLNEKGEVINTKIPNMLVTKCTCG
ncbi:daf-7, partial [Pristionchus pacificus]|uniref:Daf-7 n=1 Tax=Pristionchus pacificus TaxID=54126 RepID=A0A2A6BQ26_PRIPA